MLARCTELELRVRDLGRKLIARQKGAGMVEYTLLVTLVGLVLIAVIGLITNALDVHFRTAASAF